MNTAVEHEWLVPLEAAEQLRCSRRTIYRMVESGVLAAARLPGGHIRIRAADLDALLDAKPPTQLVRKTHPWRTLEVPQ